MVAEKEGLGEQEATEYGLEWTHMETYIAIMSEV